MTIARAHKALQHVLPYVADAGAVAYVAVAAFAFVVVVAEFFSPGLVASAVAPQSLVAAMLVCGALSLAHVASKPPSRVRIASYALVGAASVAFAFWASWYYFSPVPDVRGRLAAAIGLIVGLVFASAATRVPEGV
jgi:hypothetical protein